MSIAVLNGGEEEPFDRSGRLDFGSNIHEFSLTTRRGSDIKTRPLTSEDFARTESLGRVSLYPAISHDYN